MPDANEKIRRAQFAKQQTAIDKRRSNLDDLQSLLASGDKKKVKQAQIKLKAQGRYSGPIDGAQGKGTTKALKSMREAISRDQSGLDTRISGFNKNLQGKRDASADKANRQFNNAVAQTAFNAGSLIVSSAVVHHQVKSLNKADAPAVKARNKELDKFARQITAIENDRGVKTQKGNYKATTKRRFAAVALEAEKAGVTRYRGPLNIVGGGVLLAKGALLHYGASKTDNEYLSGAFTAVGNGLLLAGAGTPASRVAKLAFGQNQLNGKSLAKIAEAKSIAGPGAINKVRETQQAAKRVTAKSAVKVAGKTALKAVPVAGLAAALYFAGEAAYNAFSKTGSAAKAAEAGLDDLAGGLIKKAKRDRVKSLDRSKAINSRRKQIQEMRRNSRAKVRSVKTTLKQDRRANPITPKTAAIKPVVMAHKSRVKVKSHTRKTGLKRARVRSYTRKNIFN